MTRHNGSATGTVIGIALIFVGLAIADYKLKHPKCQRCGLALEAVKLAEKAVCPGCGEVLTGLQALLA